MIKTRILKLQQELQDGQAFLITDSSNRLYLTNFNSSAGAVLITKTKSILFVDFRYFEKAKQVVNSCEVLLLSNGDKDLFEACRQEKVKTIFLQAASTTMARYKQLRKTFEEIEISNENTLDLKLNEMRAVKSDDELEYIRAAQSLTEQTFDYILPRIDTTRTEREIMLDMEFFMRRLGSNGVAFDFIVVSGKNSSLPHGVPTDKKIEKGDFVTMDFGAVMHGFRSDMTRTVAINSVTDQQKAVYYTTLNAQLTAIKNIKSGAKCCNIDKIARDIIYNNGYTGCFGHSLGHGVGIDIHELPNLSPNSDAVLQVGNVVTVEPGIYIENQFGVRIEDMVYVTKHGCINLTKSNKNLIIL